MRRACGTPARSSTSTSVVSTTERDYTTDEWLDQLLTHSDHATLDRAVRDELLVAVADVVDRAGGHVAVRYDTWLVTGSIPAVGSTGRSRPADG